MQNLIKYILNCIFLQKKMYGNSYIVKHKGSFINKLTFPYLLGSKIINGVIWI